MKMFNGRDLKVDVLLVTISFVLMAVFPSLAGAKSKVIISFNRVPGASEEAIVRAVGGKIKKTYRFVPAIAATLPEQAIRKLLANSRVAGIEPDGRIRAVDFELDYVWGVKRIGAGTVHASGHKGAGVNVAVIDTGIDYTHPDLDGNYVGGHDFVNQDDDPMDDHGHGTHVAGIVAAEDNGFGGVGVAPEANLYALKVMDATGSGNWSDVIAAMEWCIANGVHVINMSFVGEKSRAVEAECQRAYGAGILLVAAAGNSGDARGWGVSVEAPACYYSVIAVGATDQYDERPWWSSTGYLLELMAPGVAINSTYPGGGIATLSGTSMAAPHVAGTAALLLAARGLNNRDLRLTLQQTADDLGRRGWDMIYGYGLVDADGAVLGEGVSVPVDEDGDGYSSDADCNDSDPGIFPGATEVCNGVDDNCDGVIDEGHDSDEDGHTWCAGDCDDNDSTRYPGASETECDNTDNDCDGSIDENYISYICGVGACEAMSVCMGGIESCVPGSPEEEEVCGDGIDNDCNGAVDDGCGSSSTTCGDGVCAGYLQGEDCHSCPTDCICFGWHCLYGCCGDGVCRRWEKYVCPVDCAR